MNQSIRKIVWMGECSNLDEVVIIRLAFNDKAVHQLPRFVASRTA